MTPTTTYTQALVRIKELENDAARWRHAHDEIVKYAADKSEEARESLQEAGEEITRLREENAALREDKARLDWLLENVEGDRETERIGAWIWDIATLLCPVDYGEANDTQKWGRAAIDAARKEPR